MNFSVPMGLILGITVVIGATFSSVTNSAIFLSPHAALIVIGGTAAAALICFPIEYFFNMGKVLLNTVTGKRRAETIRTVHEIVLFAEALAVGTAAADEVTNIKNPFLREVLELMENGGLSEVELEEVLEKRVEFQNERYKRDSLSFKIIGKFPPAFGLVGTSVGMIALLQGIGQPDAFSHLGQNMSLALVATFYGLVLANLLLIPMAENLSQASQEDLVMRRIVVDGVKLIKQRRPPLLVEEYLNSYLPPGDRVSARKG